MSSAARVTPYKGGSRPLKFIYEEGAPLYPIQRMNMVTGKPFNDGEYILYVNGEYRGEDDLGKLMHDFNCNDPADMNYKILAERAKYFKENPEGVSAMCKAMDDLRIESEKKGAENILTLMQKLFAAGRVADAEKATNDKAFCAKLLAEFGLAQ